MNLSIQLTSYTDRLTPYLNQHIIALSLNTNHPNLLRFSHYFSSCNTSSLKLKPCSISACILHLPLINEYSFLIDHLIHISLALYIFPLFNVVPTIHNICMAVFLYAIFIYIHHYRLTTFLLTFVYLFRSYIYFSS